MKLPDNELPALFQIIVECHDEDEQRALYERLAAEGFECRVVSL
jgi:SNF2 family DNA or RNA helicase